MTFARSLLTGAAAGAAGTVALNLASYGDMAARGRPASEAPSNYVKHLAGEAGLTPLTADDQTAKNRRSGIGALLGYANGLGIGVLYGALRPASRGTLPAAVLGLAAGAAAMALSDVPLARSGVSDPKTWGVDGWVTDAIPHIIFGLVVAATFDALSPAPMSTD